MADPILWWVRRDMRTSDNPGLSEAAATGRPVIPVFLLDPLLEGHGACPRWRLGLGAACFATGLEALGSRLIFRRGEAGMALATLAAETGARSVWWGRLYDPHAQARDAEARAVLEAEGLEVRTYPGHVLFEPDSVETGTGGPYKVYSPYWRAVKDREVGAVLPAVTALAAPDAWPESDDPAAWDLAAAMARGAAVVRRHVRVGEAAAQARLDTFMRERVADYGTGRNMVAESGTSGLSEHLTTGEISVRAAWHAGQRARQDGMAGAETYLRELVWRDFAHHLAARTPRLVDANWREGWDAFPWSEDADSPEVRAWRQGRTGIPLVDAAMREMWVTGTMHNRARMNVASYLTKHLLTHWRIGQAWFEECLADWDPANNALGWQWAAGSGPDAAPYFRIFNPLTQAETFDPGGAYRRAWIAEGQDDPPDSALAFFESARGAWGLSAGDAYPAPVVGHAEGRQRALQAYGAREF